MYYVYYDKDSNKILDFLPKNIDDDLKAKIINTWNQEIPRKILLVLSNNENMTAPRIKEEIGHSMSTLHENIKKLEDDEIIESKMIYEGNKQKILNTNIFFVTANPGFKAIIKKAINQGIWPDTEKTKLIIDYLDKNPEDYYSAEDLSRKLDIPVDEVKILLENWDSVFNRGLSELFKKQPFERRVMYRTVKN